MKIENKMLFKLAGLLAYEREKRERDFEKSYSDILEAVLNKIELEVDNKNLALETAKKQEIMKSTSSELWGTLSDLKELLVPDYTIKALNGDLSAVFRYDPDFLYSIGVNDSNATVILTLARMEACLKDFTKEIVKGSEGYSDKAERISKKFSEGFEKSADCGVRSCASCECEYGDAETPEDCRDCANCVNGECACPIHAKCKIQYCKEACSSSDESGIDEDYDEYDGTEEEVETDDESLKAPWEREEYEEDEKYELPPDSCEAGALFNAVPEIGPEVKVLAEHYEPEDESGILGLITAAHAPSDSEIEKAMEELNRIMSKVPVGSDENVDKLKGLFDDTE